MSDPVIERSEKLRAVIDEFLRGRLEKNLKKLEIKLKNVSDESEKTLARQKEQDRFANEPWLRSAAYRTKEIQRVTHPMKATHPGLSIWDTTSFYILPSGLPKLDVVGSHTLGDVFHADATGNSGALDVNDFLKQTFEGRTILDLVLAKDADLALALSNDPDQSAGWITDFSKIVEPRCLKPTSDSRAKQIFWPVGESPHNDAEFHVLSPMYPSSLVHRFYLTLMDDKFSDEAKAARIAKKAGAFSDRPVRDYLGMAIQHLGGSKPPLVSQLNSVRNGRNYLLASLPPSWKSADIKPIFNADSMFPAYGARSNVKATLAALLSFLKSNPPANLATRSHRAELFGDLMEEFLQFSAALRSLPAGWSQSEKCNLDIAQKHWLDPQGAAQACENSGHSIPVDIEERISAAFALWLRTRLNNPLPIGDVEYVECRKQMEKLINEQEAFDV